MAEQFNIASLLTEAAAKWPQKVALVSTHRPDALGRTQITMAELEESSSHLAAYLLNEEKAEPGAKVVVLVKPGIDLVVITFALFKAGLVPVLIDPGMGLKAMTRCLSSVEPRGLIGLARTKVLSLLAPSLAKHLKWQITVSQNWPWGNTLKKIMAAPPPLTGDLPILAGTKANDMAALLFTSGSTGPAKGVVYTHAMFRAQIEAISSGFGLLPGGVDLATFALFGLFAPALGLTSIIPDMPTSPAQTKADNLLEPIIKHGVTSMFASPTVLNKIAQRAEEKRIALPTLRLVMAAGAPIDPALAAKFCALLEPQAKLLTPYGATEGVPLTTIEAGEIIRETGKKTKAGFGMCVGRPLASVRLGIVKISSEIIANVSDDIWLPTGEIGEIVASGPMVAAEYYNRPHETALSIIKDGKTFWRRLGDVGWLDEQGRLWFCGRKAHRVVTADETLFSIPCEAIFNQHPQVRRSALVGVGEPGAQKPIIIIEPISPIYRRETWLRLETELLELGQKSNHTNAITMFLKHSSFPMDVRHNAKINREALTTWAHGEYFRPKGG